MHILSSLSQCKVSVLIVVSVPFYIYQFIISHESNKQCQVFNYMCVHAGAKDGFCTCHKSLITKYQKYQSCNSVTS